MFMGPPGAGKGTQARMAQSAFGFERIETGAILRAMRKEDTPTAKLVTELVDAGKLAPAPLVAELVINKTREILGKGKCVVFDGSPRTLFEAQQLMKALFQDKVGNILVVGLDISLEQARRRLMIRVVCKKCNTPTTEDKEKCEKCGGELVKRADDDPIAMETRWDEYNFRTLPTLNYLEKFGIVEHVNADQSVEEIAASVNEIIKKKLKL